MSININYISSESSRVLNTARPVLNTVIKLWSTKVIPEYAINIINNIIIICGKPWFCVLVLAINLLSVACCFVIPMWRMRNMHCKECWRQHCVRLCTLTEKQDKPWFKDQIKNLRKHLKNWLLDLIIKILSSLKHHSRKVLIYLWVCWSILGLFLESNK